MTRRLQFSLLTLFLLMAASAVLVTIGRQWLPGIDVGSTPIRWREYNPKVVKQLRKQRKPLLVHFTADWDLSSHAIRAGVIETPEVREAVHRHGYIPIWVDCTKGFPPELNYLGINEMPTTVVIPGRNGRQVVFRGAMTKQRLLSGLAGDQKEKQTQMPSR